ncbi:hypothetical protein DM01DRAFT_1339150 [Hesseltinella vesiculosa]|uniref:C2H2-type domain-containing protein n=1 Tax=Hesseltinella vesiculosa TaxID=101127 RepID=A0A1X2G892_9FUNG|nr:hypothetical protein DM01DRAFT_1339150 [Hesseltinella vesiculosa]
MTVQNCCPFCEIKEGQDPKTFSTGQKVRDHILKVHKHILLSYRSRGKKATMNTSRTWYSCPSCDKHFENRHLLQEHAVCHICRSPSPASLSTESSDSAPIDDCANCSGDDLAAFAAYRNDSSSHVKDILAVDSKISDLLAVSSIMLLQKRVDYNHPLSPEMQASLRRTILDPLARKFDPLAKSTLNDCVLEYVDDTRSLLKTRIKLLEMADGSTGPSRNVILALESLIPAHKDLDRAMLQESEICSSFVHPFIQSLCALDHPSKLAKCANTIPTDEAGDSTSRPDYIVDVYEEYTRVFSSCFGEVKGDGASAKSAAFDFYRLSVFGKNQMDAHGLNMILLFQVVGTDLTFYLLKHLQEDVYAMVEVVTIGLPRTRGFFKTILGDIDNILTIAHIHNSIERLETPLTPSATLPIEYARHETKTLPKKRKLPLGHLATSLSMKH